MRQPFWHDIQRYKRERGPGVLVGVRQICAYCQIGKDTFYRWKDKYGFPVTTTPEDTRYMTTARMVDEWVLARWRSQEV